MNRYRNLAVLVVVIAAQLLLLAYQVRSNQDVSLLRSASVAAVTPLARLLDAGRESSLGFFRKYFYLLHVEQENQKLRQDLDRLKLENQFLRTELTTADRARALALFQQQTRSKTLAARVIGTGTGANSKAVFVDRGQADGVQRGMAVITPDGIVGKVTFVYPNACQVLLITDPSFAAGVISQKNRVPGTLKGLGRSQVLVDYVQNEVNLEDGEWFFTSGDDRIFPKGLPAGQVRLMKRGKTFKEIFLDPSGLWRGLEEVLIVMEGAHQLIPEGDGPSPAAGPVASMPSPDQDPSAASPDSGLPYLSTDADRARERIRRIGELQGVQFGSAGSRLPNFNMDPSQATRSPAAAPPQPGAAAPPQPGAAAPPQPGAGAPPQPGAAAPAKPPQPGTTASQPPGAAPAKTPQSGAAAAQPPRPAPASPQP